MNIEESLLKNLYNGNINPNKTIPKTEEYNALVSKLNKVLKDLFNNLTEENKKLLNYYIEIKTETESIECQEKFEEGYKMAVKLILSGLLN